MQLSQSGRVVRLVSVSQGTVYTCAAGESSWVTPTNTTGDTPALNYTGVVASAPNVEKLWFADGINWVYYDARAQTVNRWSPSAGILPVDSENNTPRLICTWRGRTCLSGLLLDPQNWFYSAVGVPTDFDYAPLDITPTQAVAGNNGPLGLVGDVVTGMIPYSDDVMIFGCDSSIFLMAGDPMAGGQIDRVTDAIGMAWGQAWAKDPYGTVYFVSSKTGIYTMRPGEIPQRISQPVESIVHNLDTGANTIRCIWDDQFQGMHFFFTPSTAPGAATHLFYEQRNGAWWKEVFANNNHNPVACCTFDGNTAADRVALIGSWDGWVRSFSPSAVDDDGTAIASFVVIGPLTTKELDELMLKELQAVLGETSGSVTYAVYQGRTAEEALSSTAITTGTWAAGRNTLEPIRRAAHNFYVKISSTVPWSFEQLRALVGTRGMVRRRGY